MSAVHRQTRSLTSYFSVARPITMVSGVRRSGWRRFVDHDCRSLRELGHHQFDHSQAHPSHPAWRSEATRHWRLWAGDTATVTSGSSCVPRRVAVHALNRIHGTAFSRFVRYGFLVVLFLLNACGAAGDIQPGISFKPTLLPVKFTAGPSGFVVTGDRTIVTQFGLFSIGAKFDLPTKDDDEIRVVIRDRK